MSQETITLPKSVVKAIFLVGLYFGATTETRITEEILDYLSTQATEQGIPITKREIERALSALEELEVIELY